MSMTYRQLQKMLDSLPDPLLDCCILASDSKLGLNPQYVELVLCEIRDDSGLLLEGQPFFKTVYNTVPSTHADIDAMIDGILANPIINRLK